MKWNLIGLIVLALKRFPHIDSEHYIHKSIKDGKKILSEGAQGTLLDIDFGSYPFVTSSNTITLVLVLDLELLLIKLEKLLEYLRYCTRVGSGPFPTELFDEIGERLGRIGNEFGATTGRPRRCGWIDLPALKYILT